MRPNKRDELVRNALEVFHRNGFHATGMDMIAAKTGVSKTSIYKHFRTKDELILAVLRLRDENFRNWLVRRVEALEATPEARLLAIFDVLRGWFETPEFSGCMFIKASSEFQSPKHPIHVQSSEHQRMVMDYLARLADGAGFSSPEDIAKKIWLLMQGAIVGAAMRVQDDPAGEAQSVVKIIFANAPRT